MKKICRYILHFFKNTPKTKPDKKDKWSLLIDKLAIKHKRRIALFSDPRFRIQNVIVVSTPNIDVLISELQFAIDKLQKQHFIDIKAMAVKYSQIKPYAVNLDDYLLTQERRYVKNNLLSEYITKLEFLFNEFAKITKEDFDCEVIISSGTLNALTNDCLALLEIEL